MQTWGSNQHTLCKSITSNTNVRNAAQRSWPSGFVTWQPLGLASYHPLTPSHTLTPLRGIKKYKLNLQKKPNFNFAFDFSSCYLQAFNFKCDNNNNNNNCQQIASTDVAVWAARRVGGGGGGGGSDRIHISQSHSRPNRFRLRFQTIDDADDDFAPGLFGLWGHAAALWLQLLLLLLLLQWQLNCEMIIFIAWPDNKIHSRSPNPQSKPANEIKNNCRDFCIPCRRLIG